MIYFIRDPLSRRVKIGLSDDPWKRLAYIQIGCPSDLELAGVEPGEEAREKALHQQFAAYRVRGEWFSETAELAQYIATLAVPIRPQSARASREPLTPLDRWLFENRMSAQEFGRQFGLGAAFISHMRHGRRQPTLDVACAIADRTGLRPHDLIVSTREERSKARAA